MLSEASLSDLKEALTSAELAAIAPSVLGVPADEADEARDLWLQAKLDQASRRVIAECNSCALNPQLSVSAGRVPASQVHTVLVLARHAVISCIPGMAETLEGSSRQAEYNTATRELDRLASCDLRVDGEILEEDESGLPHGMGVLTRPSFDFRGL